MAKYSIIVPVYNSERYLKDCLLSIRNQEYSNFEVILVDDGSMDESGHICDCFAAEDMRFKIIHKQNEGVSAARNTGIDAAGGEWISFVDSDDMVSPCYLSTFEEFPDKADVTYFGHRQLSHNQFDIVNTIPSLHWTGWDEIQQGMLTLKENGGHYGYAWNKFFRADIIRDKRVRYISGISILEDELFADEFMFHCNSISTIPEILYSYRKVEGGLSQNYNSAHCLKLYARASEAMVDRWDNQSLISNQINYLFIVKMRVLDYTSSLREHRMEVKEALRFARKYGTACVNVSSFPSGTMGWAIWNYYNSWRAGLSLFLHIIIRQMKRVMGVTE